LAVNPDGSTIHQGQMDQLQRRTVCYCEVLHQMTGVESHRMASAVDRGVGRNCVATGGLEDTIKRESHVATLLNCGPDGYWICVGDRDIRTGSEAE
jgi:hypothetical protein